MAYTYIKYEEGDIFGEICFFVHKIFKICIIFPLYKNIKYDI